MGEWFDTGLKMKDGKTARCVFAFNKNQADEFMRKGWHGVGESRGLLGLLDNPIGKIKDILKKKLPVINEDDLRALLEAEINGNTRKGVVKLLTDEIACYE